MISVHIVHVRPYPVQLLHGVDSHIATLSVSGRTGQSLPEEQRYNYSQCKYLRTIHTFSGLLRVYHRNASWNLGCSFETLVQKLVPGASEICLWDSRYDACRVCFFLGKRYKTFAWACRGQWGTSLNCGYNYCGINYTHCGHTTVI